MIPRPPNSYLFCPFQVLWAVARLQKALRLAFVELLRLLQKDVFKVILVNVASQGN